MSGLRALAFSLLVSVVCARRAAEQLRLIADDFNGTDFAPCSDGRPSVNESECLASVMAVAEAVGKPVRPKLKQVETDQYVPAGCSYSRRTSSAIYNRHAKGGATNEQYERICKAECPAGQRMPEESECLAAVQAKASAAGKQLMRRKLKVADTDQYVPKGCAWSHKTNTAVFNHHQQGGSDAFYERVCVSKGEPAGKAIDNEPAIKITKEVPALANEKPPTINSDPFVVPANTDTPKDTNGERAGRPSIHRDDPAGERALGFIPYGGWGNQLQGLRHALFLAKSLSRGLIEPRVLKHEDFSRLPSFSEHGVCSKAVPRESAPAEARESAPAEADEMDQLSTYLTLGADRPPVTNFLDAAAFNVPMLRRTAAQRLDTCNVTQATDRQLAEPNCKVHQRCVEDVADVNEKTTLDAKRLMSVLVPKLSQYEEDVMEVGIVLHANAGPRCMCAIRYRDDLVGAVNALGNGPLGEQYDALHLRLSDSESIEADWDPAATVGTALAADKSRPLYIASDDLDQALALVRIAKSRHKPLRARRVVTRRDLARQAGQWDDVLAYLPLEEQKRSEFMREVLVDVLLCSHATEFYRARREDVQTTFSNHIQEQRTCLANQGLNDCSDTDVGDGLKAVKAAAARKLRARP